MIRLNMIIISLILAGIITWLVLPERLGQLINPTSNSIVSCLGGLCEYHYRIPLRASTNTPCSIKAPEATSTIVHASFDIRTSTTSAMLMEIGWSDNTGATTTSLASTTLLANTRQTLIATSTLQGFYPFTVPLTNHIIPGSLNATNSRYVNFRFGTSLPYLSGSSTPSGNCEIIFRNVI